MHPFVKILLFIFILLLMNFMGQQSIWLLCVFVCAFAFRLHSKNFLRAIKRMRWLFISILIIYAFGTPGEYIQGFSGRFLPTHEGVALGFLQIAKLIIALASISILFATSSKEHLMAGLYKLLSPLNYIGCDVQRFTARLLLTLDYVDELAVKNELKFNFSSLDELHIAENHVPIEKNICLQQPSFKRVDQIVIIAMMLTLIVLCTPNHLLALQWML